MGRAAQEVRTRLLVEQARGTEPVEHRHQGIDAVEHGGIHHLPAARMPRLKQGADETKGQQHPASPESPSRFSGGTGGWPLVPKACSAPLRAM